MMVSEKHYLLHCVTTSFTGYTPDFSFKIFSFAATTDLTFKRRNRYFSG